MFTYLHVLNKWSKTIKQSFIHKILFYNTHYFLNQNKIVLINNYIMDEKIKWFTAIIGLSFQ